MSPPNAFETARKGCDLVLRSLGLAPEFRAAKRLGISAPGCGPKVLVLSPRSWAVHVQWESIVARALQARGADVVVVTCGGGLEICDRVNTWEGPPPPCRSCSKYVDTGIRAHSLRSRSLSRGWPPEPDWPELDCLGPDELLEIEHEGVPLGRLVDIPVKWFLLSTAVEKDPLAVITRRRFLRSARRIQHALQTVLEEERPDRVFALNGLFLFESILLALARERDIPVTTYERGFIRDSLFVSRDAPAARYDVSHVWQKWRDVPLNDDEERELDAYLADRTVGARSIVQYWPTSETPSLTLDGTNSCTVAFPNITWDSAVQGRRSIFADLEAWLLHLVRWFERRPHHALIIRIHPAEVRLPGKFTREPVGRVLEDLVGLLPPNVSVVDADDPTSSYMLIDRADCVLAYSSTVGLEAALRAKRVVVSAETHYHGKGFTLDPRSVGAHDVMLERILEGSDPPPVEVELARRYAYLFFFRAPVPMPFVSEPVPGLVRLHVSDQSELHRDVDGSLERICQLILNGVDPVLEL